MKKIMISFILGGIIFGTIGALAATTISSNNVTYQNKTVNSALDELYNKISNKTYSNGTVIYYNPETNKKCSSSEAVSTTGTKTGCMKWYTFNDEGITSKKINMILDHNTTATVSWNISNGMNEVIVALSKDTVTWNNDLNARLITANEIAEITGNTSFNGTTSTYSNWFYFDSNNQTQTVTTQGTSKYAWLFDYTNSCTNYGCNVADSSNYGYWTSTPVAGSGSRVWRVYYAGRLSTYFAGSEGGRPNYGVRPVITVSKSIIS